MLQLLHILKHYFKKHGKLGLLVRCSPRLLFQFDGGYCMSDSLKFLEFRLSRYQGSAIMKFLALEQAAVDAMSMEIMLLGAISLLLLIVEDKITSICFNRDLNQSWTMLYRVRGCPCCLKDTARVTNCFLHERKCGPSACNCENGNPMCLVRPTEIVQVFMHRKGYCKVS